MARYLLADLLTTFTCRSSLLQRRCCKYQVQAQGPDHISMDVPLARIQALQARHPHLSLGEAELLLLSSRFSAQLIDHQGLVLHASAIAHQGRAVLFSAASGVGKSTHTRLWQKQFGAEAAAILDDDKPALRLLDGQWWVYGTPFSGNSEENRNQRCPLHALVFLERSPHNAIRRLSVEEALPYCLFNLPPYRREVNQSKLMALVGQLLPAVPVYLLSCNMDPEAAVLAQRTLFPGQRSSRYPSDGVFPPSGA